MDLESVLQKVINKLELPTAIKRGYMNGKKIPELRIYSLPGSNVISCDYEGNKTEQFNFEIAMRSDDEALINQCLFLIIVGRKSPYFSEGLDSPSLRQ